MQIVKGSAERLLNLGAVRLFGPHNVAADNYVSQRFDANMDTQRVLLCYVNGVRTALPQPVGFQHNCQ